MKRVLAYTDSSINTVLRGTQITGKLYSEVTYQELVPTLNCIIGMKDRIADRLSSVNQCEFDPDNMRLELVGCDIFIYFTCSVDDYIQGRHIDDEGLREYLRSKLGSTTFNIGGYLSYMYMPTKEVSKDAIWDELTEYDNYWKTNEFSSIKAWIDDYYTKVSGRYNPSPMSFSWSLRSLFGRNYAFPETGDFVSDVDSCYSLLDAKLSEIFPNFELNIDRQVDYEDDEDFEDVLKFKFSDKLLKTRLYSSELKREYDSKGSKGIMSMLLGLIRRTPDKVKVIQR